LISNNFQIVVPFYNDEKSFDSFVEILNKMDIEENIFILLDNGSNNERIKTIAQKKSHYNWTFIRNEKNLGFGGGIKYASRFVEKDFVAWMPGNLKLNPSDVYEVLSKQNLNEKYLYIKCTRKDRPKIDHLKTKIFGIIASLYFGKKIFDAGGTPNLIHKDFFSIEKNFPRDFSFDVFVYYYCLLNNFKIKRPAITYKTRLHGESHWQKGILSEIKLTYKILKYKKNWIDISKIKI
tara:strand:- start:753 stop:1460 length:708 start_codon:yes stop_codon:yes gene_type:complete